MEIKADRCKIWSKKYQGKNGEFFKYTASISKKNQDGEWVNAYIPIRFSKKSGAPEVIENGTTIAFSGFVVPDVYKDKEGRERSTPLIIAMEVRMDVDEKDLDDNFQQAEEDIPF